MYNSKQTGFTLIEISIVIIVVGVLIGGILAAQSMQETGKVQAQVRQIGQIDASVLSFIDKYLTLPGDASSFEVVGATQDDLVVDSSADDQYDEESANFFRHLSNSGFKREDGGGAYTTSHMVGVGFPAAEVGVKENGIYVHGNSDPQALDIGSIGNAYIIADCSTMTNADLSCGSGLSGSQVIALDQKMDDGSTDTGNVVAFDLPAASDTWTDMLDGAEADVAPSNDQDDAILVIRVGASHGAYK